MVLLRDSGTGKVDGALIVFSNGKVRSKRRKGIEAELLPCGNSLLLSVLLAVEVLSAHVARGRAESDSRSSCCLPLVPGKYEKFVVWSISEWLLYSFPILAEARANVKGPSIS